MIKLSDYVIDFLVKKNISDIFLVSGGGIMYLCDSVGKNKKMRYISQHHEQACAIAAESYSRVKNHPGACLVTTGPGGTNALTGVAGAWVDSVPMMVLSGQVRTQIIADYKQLRQLGPQELNLVAMAKPITKYAKTVMDPEAVKYELEKAYYIATSDRPGPVWLDFPLDIQSTMIDEKKLCSYSPQIKKKNKNVLINSVKKTLSLLKKSRRPVLILGYGIRLAGALQVLDKFIDKINAPILLPYNGLDLVPTNHPLYQGKFGPVGTRAGNFALQSSDLLLSIGASLSTTSTGFDFKHFAFNAKKIMVNIDQAELNKPTVKIDLRIEADAKDFIEEFLRQSDDAKLKYLPQWYDVCKYWKTKYPQIIPDFFSDNYVNSYVFFDRLSDQLTEKDIVVTGNSLDSVSLYQALKVKKGQRAFTNTNLGPMGWCIPAAIGSCVANGRRRTILVSGDGSSQFNIQELETIKDYKLPIKIFILNNKGYESIRTTQENFFKGNYVGSDEKSGVGNPNFRKLAQAYSLKYRKINNNSEIKEKVKEVLRINGPFLCELHIDPNQHRIPRVSSFRRPDGTLESKPLHDMAPFLPREEIYKNMHMIDDD